MPSLSQMEADFSGKGLMLSGEEAERALQPWDEENGSTELLEAKAKEKVESEAHEDGESDGNGDQEFRSNGKHHGDENDIELPSFMNNLSTLSLPDFHTKSQLPALDTSWDNNHDLGDVLGELDDERKDCGQEGDENHEDWEGHDALVSYLDVSRSPEHSFTPAFLRSV